MGWLCINCQYSNCDSRYPCCSKKCTGSRTSGRRSVDSMNEEHRWREKASGEKRRLSEHGRLEEGHRRNRNGENWVKASKSDASEERYKDGEYWSWRNKEEERRKDGCSIGEYWSWRNKEEERRK